MVLVKPGTPIGEGIYHCDWNLETKPTVVSKVVGMARNGWAAVAPMD